MVGASHDATRASRLLALLDLPRGSVNIHLQVCCRHAMSHLTQGHSSIHPPVPSCAHASMQRPCSRTDVRATCVNEEVEHPVGDQAVEDPLDDGVGELHQGLGQSIGIAAVHPHSPLPAAARTEPSECLAGPNLVKKAALHHSLPT